MHPPRNTTGRWWVWALVPLATVAGAVSAFPHPAVRTTVGKLGPPSKFAFETRVWGVPVETVDATTTDPRAHALAQERRWRAVLATASALVSGGAAAVVAAILFASMGKPPQFSPSEVMVKTRGDYERAVRVVREVIRRWDPYGLLAAGCPPDEFDAEAAAVVGQIPRIRSSADAANALSRVFSSAFGAEGFRPEDCAVAGAGLYEALAADGLLPP